MTPNRALPTPSKHETIKGEEEEGVSYGKPYVWVDPARLFGEPCVGGTRLSTRTIADYVWNGMDFEEVLEMWGGLTGPLDRRAALVALWHEARYSGTRQIKKAWKDWGKEAGAMLWHTDGELPSPPPPREEVTS